MYTIICTIISYIHACMQIYIYDNKLYTYIYTMICIIISYMLIAMENQLEELGKRWLEASSEVEDLKHFMEMLKQQKSTFVMKLGEFKEWLMETEALLNGVLRLETGDENLEHVVQQVKCLKVLFKCFGWMVEIGLYKM